MTAPRDEATAATKRVASYTCPGCAKEARVPIRSDDELANAFGAPIPSGWTAQDFWQQHGEHAELRRSIRVYACSWKCIQAWVETNQAVLEELIVVPMPLVESAIVHANTTSNVLTFSGAKDVVHARAVGRTIFDEVHVQLAPDMLRYAAFMALAMHRRLARK